MSKYVVFDFDGVLCDSTKLAYEIHNSLAVKYNLPNINSSKDYLSIIDDSNINFFLNLDDKKSYYKDHRDNVYINKAKLQLFKEVIMLLSSNSNFSIVSSTYEKIIREILNQNKIDLLRVYGRETDGGKIDKIYKIFNELNITNNDIIYIGDTIDDLRFCEKAKIDMYASNYGYSNFDNVKSLYLKKVFKTPLEMSEYVMKNFK